MKFGPAWFAMSKFLVVVIGGRSLVVDAFAAILACMSGRLGYRIAWLVVLLVAAGVRLYAPDWDSAIAAHPDERFLLGVAQAAPLTRNLCRVAPEFPYGHLPVTLARILVLAAPEADPLFAARLLSALVGWLLVPLSGVVVWSICPPHWDRRWRRRAVLLGAMLATFAPFLIQQAHFYTVDPLATALACSAVLAGARRRFGAAGVLTGLALACKLSIGLIIPALAVSMVWTFYQTHGCLRGAFAAMRHDLVPLGIGTVGAFVIASPWSLITPVACWQGPVIQSLMAAGRFDFPYTRQYAHTLPYIYPMVQMGLWGVGFGAMVAGLVGLFVAPFHLSRHSERLAWVWTVLYIVAVGGLAVKFPRYLLPIYPWWLAWAARSLIDLCVGPRRVPGSRLIIAAVMLLTLVPGMAQVSVYARPHPWIVASRWLYGHQPPATPIAVEAWDHPLPVPLPCGSPERFEQITAPIFLEASADKARQLAGAAEADVVVLATRRGYGAISRMPDRYPATLAWYRDLFGIRTVRTFSRCPRIGLLALTDDPLKDAGLPVAASLAERCDTPFALRLPRLDESFRVYDAPTTVLLGD